MYIFVLISDHLNVAFLQFVFESIENPPTYEHEDQVTDLLINFVLAFNLHCKQPKDNLVLHVIEERKTVKVFTEKVLLLFNRDGERSFFKSSLFQNFTVNLYIFFRQIAVPIVYIFYFMKIRSVMINILS